MNHGRLDRALEVFEQAMTRYPSYVWGWSDMGICLLGMDRYAEAERALTRATELGADDVGTWAPLGATRLLQGNLDGALDCLRVCVEIDIHDPGTRRLAAMMHDHLQEAVAATGEDDPAVHDLLGDLRQIVEADQSRHPGPGPPSGRARRSRREGRC